MTVTHNNGNVAALESQASNRASLSLMCEYGIAILASLNYVVTEGQLADNNLAPSLVKAIICDPFATLRPFLRVKLLSVDPLHEIRAYLPRPMLPAAVQLATTSCNSRLTTTRSRLVGLTI